jgi:hypothetical protein
VSGPQAGQLVAPTANAVGTALQRSTSPTPGGSATSGPGQPGAGAAGTLNRPKSIRNMLFPGSSPDTGANTAGSTAKGRAAPSVSLLCDHR